MSATPKKHNLVVTHHAIERYRQRHRDPNAGLWEVEALLKAEIRDALDNGRCTTVKPKRYRMWMEKKKGKMDPGQRFVYREDLSMAWILKADGHKRIVVTTLSPTVSA
jgi:hypothetical protein